MNKQDVLALMVDDVVARRAQISDYIKSPYNSYEDCLEVWEATPDHLVTRKSWILHLPQFEKKYGEINWFDDYYCERYTDVDLRDIVQAMYDNTDPEEKIKDFICECMSLGIHTFNLDW